MLFQLRILWQSARPLMMTLLPLWGALLLATSLYNPDPNGFKYCLLFMLASSTALQLQLSPQTSDGTLLRYIGWLALAAALLFCGRFIYLSFTLGDQFNAAHQISGMTSALLAPFLILLAQRRPWLVGITLTLLMALLLASNSRTEVLALGTALAVFLLLHYRCLKWTLPAAVILIATVVGLDMLLTDMDVSQQSGWYDTLNRLSSNRLDIWSSAIQHPPENIWLGLGASSSVGLPFIPGGVRHLHNSVLELWYEGGLLSVGLWLGILLAAFVWLFRQLTEDRNRHLACVLGATLCATLVAISLDKSLHSPYSRYYLFYLLGLIFLVGQQPANQTEAADRCV